MILPRMLSAIIHSPRSNTATAGAQPHQVILEFLIIKHLIVFLEESRSRHDSPPVDAVSRPAKHLCPPSSIFYSVSSTAPSAVAAFGARSTPDFDRRWTCMPADARRCPPAELAPTISRTFASDSRRERFWQRMQ